jgi:dTDP-4-amino-4,6-dideoxygalactose transaminase
MPVHFAGCAADMATINEIAEAHGLLVIEDAAQAIGTEYNGLRVGSTGNPVCFSFHPNKNITTIEGGAVACCDSEMQERLQRLRFHGIVRDEQGNMDVPEWGGKMNLPDVGAAIGLTQLAQLDQFNQRRGALARAYLDRLPSHPALVLPEDVAGHSWHMFCVCIDFNALGTTRVTVQQQLQAKGIGTGIHYPAMHLFSLYQRMGYTAGDFPVAEQIGNQTLTLPLFPTMQNDDVERVCDALEEVLNEEN